jgi:hypothetical protein
MIRRGSPHMNPLCPAGDMDHLDLSARAFSRVSAAGGFTAARLAAAMCLPGRCYKQSWEACFAEVKLTLCSSNSRNLTLLIFMRASYSCWHKGPTPVIDWRRLAACLQLAPQGKGIIGLKYRPVPCSAAARNGVATKEEWDKMRQDVGACAAAPSIC